MLEMLPGGIDMIADERAAGTTLVPTRTEHKVVDDQLAAAIEQIGQSAFAVRPLEHILLFHLDPGKVPARLADLVPQSRELFFLCQQLLARLDPFALGNDRMVGDPRRGCCRS